MKLQTPKGFRDYLPADAIKRQIVVDKIKKVFQKYGFDPLETPTLEYEETLTGKYGEEERLIYKFQTAGEDKVALKYDQTVPLARVVAQYGPKGAQTLPIPFKRYQIQPAYRGENTQKGRYREFLQCDADIVGINSPLADAEILSLIYEIYNALGLEIIIRVNDRALIADIDPKYLSAIDKLAKIDEEGVLKELQEKGLSKNDAEVVFGKVISIPPSKRLEEARDLFAKMGNPVECLEFDSSLIRGLDYYTGIIMEVVLKNNPTSSSLGGGGRWDNMIGKFTGLDMPAIGFSVGLERTIEAMEESGVLDVGKTKTQLLVTVFSTELEYKSLEVSSRLRSNDIPTEVWLDPDSKLDKQLKYADSKGIPFVVIIGPDEAESDKVVLKDLKKRTQETLTLDEVVAKLRQ